MWYIYILLSHKKKEFESILVRWMNLELVMQSEVSQKEKNKYCILAHIYGIWKNCIDEPICREGEETQTEGMELWTQQGKEGGTNETNSMKTYIAICKIDSKWEFAM